MAQSVTRGTVANGRYWGKSGHHRARTPKSTLLTHVPHKRFHSMWWDVVLGLEDAHEAATIYQACW
jgi:hypothetical protein